LDNITAIVPFWNGHATIERLLDSLPPDLPVIVVDDQSDEPYHTDRYMVRTIRPGHRGYFAGAVNVSVNACAGDVLILNQDAVLEGEAWRELLAAKRDDHALIGDGVFGHPAYPQGYVQGTFMYVRRDAWEQVGPFNERIYPLWGATCEWQLRACRQGFRALPVDVPGLAHGRTDRHGVDLQIGGQVQKLQFGEAIAEALRREPGRAGRFLHTPPLISVIVPCYNYGRYLPDAVHSLIGGATCLGQAAGQTWQSFEVVIVDDASTDDSAAIASELADPWKGVRLVELSENRGTPGALNEGIRQSYGRLIQVLSADDMLEGHALATMLDTCLRNPHHVAYGDLWILRDGQKVRPFKLSPTYDFDLVLRKNQMGAGIMYPREAWQEVGGYPEIMVHGREDWAFNIALGLHGWCGVHCGDSGYLYRREGQSRSIRTGNLHREDKQAPGFVERNAPDWAHWRQVFIDQLLSLYPNIYKGERPMKCCGGSRRNNHAVAGAGAAPAPKVIVPGRDGMVLLKYIGGNAGKMSWTGPVTKQTYIFGGSRPVGYVDAGDAPEMLDWRENRRVLFETVPEPAPEPPSPAPMPAPVAIVPDDLTTVKGVGAATAEKLAAAGIRTIQQLAECTTDELAACAGLKAALAARVVQGARHAVA